MLAPSQGTRCRRYPTNPYICSIPNNRGGGQSEAKAAPTYNGLRIASLASRFAVSRASDGGTSTSGLTPVPSQFVFVIGFIARPVGTHTAKYSCTSHCPPG